MTVWTLERIYSRCAEEDGCMLWQGGMFRKTYPVCQEPDPERRQRQVHVRRLVWELTKGAPAPVGPRYVLMAKCRNQRCVNAECLVLLPKGERLRIAAKEAGPTWAFLMAAKVAEGRRRNAKLSDAAAAAIRASDEPGHVLADRHGISEGYACAIKAGTARRDYRTPFAALQGIAGRR